MPIDLTTVAAPHHTALVLVDLQNGLWGDEARNAHGSGVVDGLVARCAKLAKAARARDIRVVHCTKTERLDGAGASLNTPMWRRRARSGFEPLVPGSHAATVLAELGPDERDIVVPRSRGASPLTGTELAPILHNLRIETLVVCGVSLNIGIMTSCSEAVSLGFEVVVPTDAVFGIPREYGELMLRHSIMPIATLTSVDDLVAAWQAG